MSRSSHSGPLQVAAEFVSTLSSEQDIPLLDDAFWNRLSTNVKEPLSFGDAKEATSTFRPFMRELVKNNKKTQNYQKFLIWMAKELETVDVASLGQQGYGLANVVYVQRLCLKILVEDFFEYVSEDGVLGLNSGLAGKGVESSCLVDHVTCSVVDALLTLLTSDATPSNGNSLAALELMKMIVTMCITTKLETKDVFMESLMSCPKMCHLGPALLNVWLSHGGKSSLKKSWCFDSIDGNKEPSAVYSITKSIASMPWHAMSLLTVSRPHGSTTDEEIDPMCSAAGSAICLLYFFDNKGKENPLRKSVDMLQDGSANGEAGCIPFQAIVNVLGERMDSSEMSCLLFYMLLRGNRNFFDYFMARTDVDVVVVPMLRLLSDVEKKSMNQLYIVMIILLMLSEESAFAQNCRGVTLKDVPFYTQKSLKDIQLDSLIILVLLQVAQYNMYSTRDMYLQTNTLATLANMAPTLSNVYPVSCQRLLGILEKLYDRLGKLSEKEKSSDNSDSNNQFNPLAFDMQLTSDYLNIILEVLNAIVTNNLTSNSTLVYCMLHKKECIDAIHADPQFHDISENVVIVVDYFCRILEGDVSSSAHTQSPHGALTTEKIQQIIENGMKTWKNDLLKGSTDLKFSYEEEASNADFFMPCIWNFMTQNPSLIYI